MECVARAQIGRAAAVALAAGLVQYLPSTAVLGQWSDLRSLPWDLCRWQGPGGGKVALTFDDGPHPEGTPAVLDKLDELGLRATFFFLGSAVEAWPEIARQVNERGHQIATHGYEHRHHLARSPQWVVRDLRRATEVMHELGMPVSWYRPTYGQATAATLLAARALALKPVIWSAWGREWATSDAHTVGSRIIRRLRSGAIVLLHDSDAFGPPGMWQTGLAALDEMAAHLDAAGLTAVTMDELVQRF